MGPEERRLHLHQLPAQWPHQLHPLLSGPQHSPQVCDPTGRRAPPPQPSGQGASRPPSPPQLGGQSSVPRSTAVFSVNRSSPLNRSFLVNRSSRALLGLLGYRQICPPRLHLFRVSRWPPIRPHYRRRCMPFRLRLQRRKREWG